MTLWLLLTLREVYKIYQLLSKSSFIFSVFSFDFLSKNDATSPPIAAHKVTINGPAKASFGKIIIINPKTKHATEIAKTTFLRTGLFVFFIITS